MIAIMPYFMTFVMAKFAAGLVIYWTVSNTWGIGQQYFTNYLIGSPAKPVVAK